MFVQLRKYSEINIKHYVKLNAFVDKSSRNIIMYKNHFPNVANCKQQQ